LGGGYDGVFGCGVGEGCWVKASAVRVEVKEDENGAHFGGEQGDQGGSATHVCMRLV
jgi:hypothetical protein